MFKKEVEMLSDLGKHLAGRIAYALYPSGVPEVKGGEVLLRPEVELYGPNGRITFD